jgi:carbon storage regulator CsrA
MLVLSRRLNEKIYFPGLNAVVEVVSIKSGVVRLGIDAPPEVTILRQEVEPRRLDHDEPRRQRPLPSTTLGDASDSFAEWLKLSSMKLGIARLQLRAGRAEEGQAALEALHHDLQTFRDLLARRKKEHGARELETEGPRPARETRDKAPQALLAGCAG